MIGKWKVNWAETHNLNQNAGPFKELLTNEELVNVLNGMTVEFTAPKIKPAPGEDTHGSLVMSVGGQ